MLTGDTTSASLLGRLLLEGRTPLAVLSVTPGRGRTLDGAHAFAVSDGLLWLAQPRFLGSPSIASVPLEQVGAVVLDAPGSPGGRVRLEITVSGRRLPYTALDDADTARAFANAVESAR